VGPQDSLNNMVASSDLTRKANPIRPIELFVDSLNMRQWMFNRAEVATGSGIAWFPQPENPVSAADTLPTLREGQGVTW